MYKIKDIIACYKFVRKMYYYVLKEWYKEQITYAHSIHNDEAFFNYCESFSKCDYKFKHA